MFADKKLLILGLGESGLAMVRWLHQTTSGKITVADTREAPARLDALTALGGDIRFVAGNFGAALANDADFIFVSPGLSPDGDLKEILSAASEKNIPVWGEVELFAYALRNLKETEQYSPKVIAITGTNGKTTVTSFTGLLCQRAGLKTRIAGNISPSMLDALLQCQINQDLPEVWVLELSSFQLHTAVTLQADAATVLNISQDHLDWHGSLAAYCRDKSRIFSDNTVQVLNRDDANVMAMVRPGSVHVSFGLNLPERAGDFGLLSEHDMHWMVLATPSEDEAMPTRRRKKEPIEIPYLISRLMPGDALQIRGQHNLANAMAALALCRAIGLPLAPLLHGLREYKGEPHRVELIATVAGIDFIDDSKGTNVGATVAALSGLGQQGRAGRIVLIAGGDGKGQSFNPLLQPVTRYAKAVMLIGKDAAELRYALQDADVPLIDCSSLEQAVVRAAEIAQEGDVVLLSPACASLDMFRNYAHRAQVFADAVREFALERGEVC